MKPYVVIGNTMLFLASTASFPTYLWLIGVLPEPNGQLLMARCFYSAALGMIGALVRFGPEAKS